MTSNNWWEAYRKEKYKVRNYLSTEMVVRKSIAETGTEYIEHGSLSVLRNIVCDKRRSIINRMFWLGISVVAFFYIYYYLDYTWVSTFTKPMVISDENFTYPISSIDFPAVAFCNVNRISKRAVKERAFRVYPKVKYMNITLQELEIFFYDLGRLTNFNSDALSSNVKMIEALSRGFENELGMQVMKELSPDCDQMFLACAWAGKKENCSDIFSTRRTILGFCCTFNYVLDYTSSDGYRPKEFREPIKKQVIPGMLNGLMVILDPLLDDYAYTVMNRRGFQVIIFDPINYPDRSGGRVMRHFLDPNEMNMLQLHSVKQLTSQEVRKYPLKTRQCLYQDDRYDMFHGRYTYSACLARCRTLTILGLCRCIPYFMPKLSLDNRRICTLNDLRCLSKYKEMFKNYYPINVTSIEGLEVEYEDSLFCPECLPDCEFVQHYIRTAKLPLSKKMFRSHFSQGLNITNKCMLYIYQQHSSGLLRRLDVMAYWFEILSNIGGFAGMMIGIGVFTIIEILYFMTIRLTTAIYLNYIKNQN